MKKLIPLLAGLLSMLSVHAGDFRALSFLPNTVRSILITNGVSAPLGGYTNVHSWTYNAIDPTVTANTNNPGFSWTNNFGNWVKVTNGVPGVTTGIAWKQGPNSDDTTADVPLPVVNFPAGNFMFANIGTNTVAGLSASCWDNSTIGYATITAKVWGDSSASGTLNLQFIAVPDGTNDATSSTLPVGGQGFQWGIANAVGAQVVTTNVPLWRFAGCKSIRLRTASITTSTAANIDVAVYGLSFNAFYP